MVPPGRRVCDVGCDHAHVDIRLLQEEKITSALAMDVAPGPLARAKENLELTGLEDRCSLRLSDGLAAYEPGEADTLICTGMGGRLMRSILEAGAEKTASFRELILSPHREISLVREWLGQSGYVIADEVFLEDAGKFYAVMRVLPGAEGICGTGPDWDVLAHRVREMTKEEEQLLMADCGSVLPLLEDLSFRSHAENHYGPCILRKFLSGDGEDEPTRSSFCRYLTGELREKLTIAGRLSEQRESENAAARLAQIGGTIGTLQVLLFLQQISR